MGITVIHIATVTYAQGRQSAIAIIASTTRSTAENLTNFVTTVEQWKLLCLTFLMRLKTLGQLHYYNIGKKWYS